MLCMGCGLYRKGTINLEPNRLSKLLYHIYHQITTRGRGYPQDIGLIPREELVSRPVGQNLQAVDNSVDAKHASGIAKRELKPQYLGAVGQLLYEERKVVHKTYCFGSASRRGGKAPLVAADEEARQERQVRK